ncbi:MAG: hypothetical protein QOJ38_1911, partial [Solirubrobacterales bacterium]|nr:hypothetical protein [Solirubrobacterales bacterium]
MALVVLLVAGLASIARADDPVPVPSDPTAGVLPTKIDPNPCPTVNGASGQASCDTQFTPIADAKTGSELFKQVGGARFNETSPIRGSFTPTTVDFYAVRFFDQNHGFAGGAACKDPETKFDDLKGCERVPVIWEYTNKPGEGPLWREVYRAEDQGFVAAIAYYARGRALAVGGTGRYPYREFSNDSTSDPDHDPSGKGRIWETSVARFGDSDWHEYGADQKPTAPNIPADPAPTDAQQPARVAADATDGTVDKQLDTLVGPAAKIGEQLGEQQVQGAEAKAGAPPTDFGAANGAANGLLDSLKGRQPDLNEQLRKPTATPMRALTAIDCSPIDVDQFCVAGGIQQLFMWHSGTIDKSYGNGSPDSAIGTTLAPGATSGSGKRGDVEAAINFRFRVRALRFVSGETTGSGQISVVGVTAGCCDLNPANDLARLLVWDNDRWRLLGPSYGLVSNFDRLRATIPDSFYAMSVRPGQPGTVSVLATPGGPESAVEPPSWIIGAIPPGTAKGFETDVFCPAYDTLALLTPSSSCTHLAQNAVGLDLSDTRLAAGDGDVSGVPASASYASFGGGGGPDAVMDWAVGERRSTGQGLAYTTTVAPQRLRLPSPLDCSVAVAVPDPNCRPASSDDLQRRVKSAGLFLLPSYRLNAFTTIGSTGISWAVGDRGALLRMGGSGDDSAVLPEPKPPRVGAAKRGPSPPSSSFAPFRGNELSSTAGTLPSLEDRRRQMPRPQIVPWGSPQTSRFIGLLKDDVSSIVTSRDGSEAWALGSGLIPAGHSALPDGRTTLYHFVDSRWQRCDPLGVSEQLPADPSCESLAPLLRYLNVSSHQSEPVRLLAATRVPLENDSDPANDDEFEVVAVGTPYTPPRSSDGVSRPAVLVYRNGRWSLDEPAMKQLVPTIFDLTRLVSVAFSAPDDGWITDTDADLFHFDGRRWTRCAAGSSQRASCGDDPGAPRLPDPVYAKNGETAPPLSVAEVGTRIYLYGGATRAGSPDYPVILYKDPGGRWTDGSGADGMGYDPGCASRDTSVSPSKCVAAAGTKRGFLQALSVAENGDGRASGWASGATINAVVNFPKTGAGTQDYQLEHTGTSAQGILMHLGHKAGSSGSAWAPWSADDAIGLYPDKLFASGVDPRPDPQLLALPGRNGEGEAFLLPTSHDDKSEGPMFRFDPGRGRWEVFPTPFRMSSSAIFDDMGASARPRMLVSDGQGGAWIAIRRMGGEAGFGALASRSATFFYRYTDEVPESPFAEVPHPADNSVVVDAAGGVDGSFWLATNTNTVYRYDRVTGWDRLSVPGWDPGRVVTHVSAARAIAIGADGNGVLVGDGGRIAELSPSGAALDSASGRSCGRGDPPPCSTGRDLDAAAVAPDGSALVGGDTRTLLWRGPGGDFQAVAKPPAALSARITGISMPSLDRAWLTTDHGEVFAGERNGSSWSWRLENDTADGTVLNKTVDGPAGEGGEEAALSAVAVDAGGFGFAVGERGLILERSGSGDHPWRRLTGLPISGYSSVTIAPGGHQFGALIGGDYGLILTLERGHLATAHQADPYDGVNTSHTDVPFSTGVPGMALIPGQHDGELEAWAVEQEGTSFDSDNRSPQPNALLHYSSDPADPLLDGVEGQAVTPPDAPPARPGELSFAVFGKSDCDQPAAKICAAPSGANLQSDIIPRRIDQSLMEPASPAQFALFSGDAVQDAGLDQNDPNGSLTGNTIGVNGTGVDERSVTGGQQTLPPIVGDHLNTSVVHRDWQDIVTRPLLDSGLPLFGAIGGQDLSKARDDTFRVAQGGTNLGYRQAMAPMPAPWGTDPKPQSRNGITWAPAEDNTTKTANDATQASTHYAVDGIKDGKKILRLVVADTSRGSLTASDPLQNPPETQSAWLEKLLCIKGSQADTGSCTREPDQQAIL